MPEYTSRKTYPALLKTVDDKLLEVGQATISVANKTVDFVSEFVQLFKMDTLIKITILSDDTEIQSFVGKVYLSSQEMLRIVDVVDEVLPGAKMACLADVVLDGNLKALVQKDPGGRFLWFKKKPSQKEETFSVSISGLSMRFVHLTTDKVMVKNQLVWLDIADPHVENVALEIEKSFIFENAMNTYYCRIKGLSGSDRLALDKYISGLIYDQMKLF